MQQASSRKKRFYQRRSFYVRMCILLIALIVFAFLYMLVNPYAGVRTCTPPGPHGQICDYYPWWPFPHIR
jgi:hypothetical protein